MACKLKLVNQFGIVTNPMKKFSAFNNSCRYSSQFVQSNNGKRLFLVDTLSLVKRLEAQGVPSKQAEAITAAITEVLSDSLKDMSMSVTSNTEMEMIQDSSLSKFRLPVQSLQPLFLGVNLENGALLLGLAMESDNLRSGVDKMRGELRSEIDKVAAGQKLDLNLERGRILGELANRTAETAGLTNNIDREIHALRAQLESAKYDVIRYCIGTLISMSAFGLAIARIYM
ncbi:hypothetical protein ACFE04_023166 [Oxalis oulophora]